MKNDEIIKPNTVIVQYKWDHNWIDQITHNIPITKVGEELSVLREIYGEVTPKVLVESSKNKNSVFHHYFEWDDKKAADAFRIKRASQILQHIEIRIVKKDEPILLKATEVISARQERPNPNKGYKKHIVLNASDSFTPEYISTIKRLAINDLISVKKN